MHCLTSNSALLLYVVQRNCKIKTRNSSKMNSLGLSSFEDRPFFCFFVSHFNDILAIKKEEKPQQNVGGFFMYNLHPNPNVL